MSETVTEPVKPKGLSFPPRRNAEPEATASEKFGAQMLCGGCRKVLGQVHFASTGGFIDLYSCPDPECKTENRFQNSPDGVQRVSRPSKK